MGARWQIAATAQDCVQHCTEFSGDGWVQYVAAFGSILASVVALGVAVWAARRESQSKPKLTLRYDHNSADDFVTDVGAGSTVQHWLRMRVANARGRRSAEDVELLILGVQTSDDDEVIRSLQGFPFHWANSQGHTTRMTIAPGVERHVDIAMVQRPPDPSVMAQDQRHYPVMLRSRIPLHLATNPKPADASDRLSAGRWVLLAVLAARDTDATYYAIEIAFDGLWHDAAEVRKHLKVKLDRVISASEA